MTCIRKNIPLKIDWPNLRHDEELEKLLSPSKPLGAEFARNVEKAMFEYMLWLHIDKLYIWDDYVTEGSTARWDFHYGAKRPENKACREHDFSNLWKMDRLEFETLVRSYPRSPNENLVREWRRAMRDGDDEPIDFSQLKFDPNLIKEKLL